MYLLDTNIVSYWMRGDSSVIQRIKTYAPADLFLSTITLAEILYGIEKSPVKTQKLGEIGRNWGHKKLAQKLGSGLEI